MLTEYDLAKEDNDRLTVNGMVALRKLSDLPLISVMLPMFFLSACENGCQNAKQGWATSLWAFLRLDTSSFHTW